MANLGSSTIYGNLTTTGILKLGNILDVESFITTHVNNTSNPHSVTASQLGASALITEINTGVNLDADTLDNQEGTYYLNFTNFTNIPDPVITLGGDLSGSLTMTNLAGGTLTATISDDSHNHIISNVDGLQGILDGKSSTNHGHSAVDIPITDSSGYYTSTDIENALKEIYETAVPKIKASTNLTFTTGETIKTYTHSIATPYQVMITSNSPQRHVYYQNKVTNSIDICIDDEPYIEDITVDVVIIKM